MFHWIDSVRPPAGAAVQECSALTLARIPESEQLVTAWDFISHDTPGECERFEKGGHDIYDVVKALKAVGLYCAEQREG